MATPYSTDLSQEVTRENVDRLAAAVKLRTNDSAHAIHMLGRIAVHLRIDPSEYLPSPSSMRSGTDWDRMLKDMLAEIERLRQSEIDANTALRLEQHKVGVLAAERDEAQAEVRAMLEGRRDEEERARMRLLESVLAAAINPEGIQATVLLPKFADLMHRHSGGSDAAWMRALLADLDALVALGLRGEVVND